MNQNNKHGLSGASEDVITKWQKLKEKINTRMNDIDIYRHSFGKKYQKIAISIAILAALNSFFVALSQFDNYAWGGFAVFALFISGTITVLSAWDSLQQPRQKYIQNAKIINDLYEVRDDMEWREDTAGPILMDEVDAFRRRFRDLEKSLYVGLLDADAKAATQAESSVSKSPKNGK